MGGSKVFLEEMLSPEISPSCPLLPTVSQPSPENLSPLFPKLSKRWNSVALPSVFPKSKIKRDIVEVCPEGVLHLVQGGRGRGLPLSFVVTQERKDGEVDAWVGRVTLLTLRTGDESKGEGNILKETKAVSVILWVWDPGPSILESHIQRRDQPRRPANTPLTLGTTVNHSASTRHLYCDGLLKYLPKGSCGHKAINISQRLGDIIPDSLPSVPRLMKSLQQGTSPGRAGWAAPNVFDLLLWGFSLSLWGWGAGVNSFHLEKVYLPPWLTYFRVSGGRAMMLWK